MGNFYTSIQAHTHTWEGLAAEERNVIDQRANAMGHEQRLVPVQLLKLAGFSVFRGPWDLHVVVQHPSSGQRSVDCLLQPFFEA